MVGHLYLCGVANSYFFTFFLLLVCYQYDTFVCVLLFWDASVMHHDMFCCCICCAVSVIIIFGYFVS